ncbi:MAG TPA: VWA domain-containing protein [Kofleriaceae bacterium]|nr:VWA domain-containing protein [Kofleriaceae bacterium]
MSPDSRKTAAILCAAGGLVAAAILLQKSATGGPAAGPTAAPTRTATAQPDPTPTRAPDPIPASCEAPAGAASRITASLSRGRATGALSASKILRGGGGKLFASFDLGADALAIAGPRQPLNLALVIDRSGSMEQEGKLARAQEAALRLIERLGGIDRIALVQYDDTAQTLVPSIAADSEGKARLRAAVAGLRPGGATNLHGGLSLGRDEVQRQMAPGQVSRVILLSDGLANAGESNPTVIADAARAAADQGVRITAVGVGIDYNEDLMEAIAESGRGRYYYVRDAAGLEPVLAGELTSAQTTVAAQVELRLRPACAGVEIGEVFGYESRRDGDTLVVPLADLAGGDARRLVVALKVPDRVAGRQSALVAELSYRDAITGDAKTATIPLALDVTDDYLAAEKSVDAEVMALVLKAQAADSVRQAARAYEKGDVAGAATLLRDTRKQVEQEGGRYGVSAAALAPALEGMSSFADQAETNAPGSAGGKALLKERKLRAREMSKGQ